MSVDQLIQILKNANGFVVIAFVLYGLYAKKLVLGWYVQEKERELAEKQREVEFWRNAFLRSMSTAQGAVDIAKAFASSPLEDPKLP